MFVEKPISSDYSINVEDYATKLNMIVIFR